jgi:hypothetical protein
MEPKESTAFNASLVVAAIAFAHANAEQFADAVSLRDLFESTDDLKVCLRGLGIAASLVTLHVVAEEVSRISRKDSDAKNSRE